MGTQENRKKLIIDTDPGIDDAMAIFLALQSPEVDVIGLTTIFGNVCTPTATANALYLLGIAGRDDIPVAEGAHSSIQKVPKLRIASFVHGSNGLGDLNISMPKRDPVSQSAKEFLIEQANKFPGVVTVVALGPLTNIAMAIQSDTEFAKKIGQIIVLGGAFAMNGNVNPAAEANIVQFLAEFCMPWFLLSHGKAKGPLQVSICSGVLNNLIFSICQYDGSMLADGPWIFGDPEAADIVFTSGANIIVTGINITHQVVMTDKDYEALVNTNGKYANHLSSMLKFYFRYHLEAYNIGGAYLHDPTVMCAAIDPSILTYEEGVVRVQTEGIFRGLTLCDNMKKSWGHETEWTNKPSIKVAVSVDSNKVVDMLMERLQKP